MSLGRAKFHINRCDESPLRGENADFWHVSKNNTGSFFNYFHCESTRKEVSSGVADIIGGL